MFSILRIAIIIGILAYLSPLRERDAGKDEPVIAWSKELFSSREASSTERLNTLWKSLPESAKQAALERAMNSSLSSRAHVRENP